MNKNLPERTTQLWRVGSVKKIKVIINSSTNEAWKVSLTLPQEIIIRKTKLENNCIQTIDVLGQYLTNYNYQSW